MDRVIVASGQTERSTDQQLNARNAMIGLGAVIAATFGSNMLASGLGCTIDGSTPNGVIIGPGSIFAAGEIDATNAGNLAADITPVMKVAMSLVNYGMVIPVPTSPGQIQCVLIEASLGEYDTSVAGIAPHGPVAPTQSSIGTSSATTYGIRRQAVVLNLVVGTPTSNGAPVAPGADPGFIPLYVVTTAYGASQVVSIATAPGAPLLTTTLPVLAATQSTSVNLSGLAPLASPSFTGSPTAPTQAAGDSSVKLATTAFVQAAAAAAAQAANSGTLYAPLNSPTFTGNPSGPTAPAGDNSSRLATTGFVAQSFAPLSSPAFAGTPTVPTPAQSANGQVANTAYIAQYYATLASPALTGTPTCPTGATGGTAQIASQAYVESRAQALAVAQTTALNTSIAGFYAPLGSPALTGTPTCPTGATGGTAQIASQSYVETRGLALAQYEVALLSAEFQFNGAGTMVFPSGFIIAWGAGTTDNSIYFHTQFPNACLSVTTGVSYYNGYNGDTVQTYGIAANGFSAYGGNPTSGDGTVSFTWMAIGY